MTIMLITELENDDKSFALHLYKNYYGLVRKTVYNITHDMGILEDLINDTFIKLIEKISLIRTLERCKTTAYIIYTSRSVAINYIKRRDIQNKYICYGEDTDLAEIISENGINIENRIIRQEEIGELVSAILRLPERQKDLLFFKYMLEMDDDNIARIFGIATNSVRQYLTRARRNAKNIMERGINKNAK